MNRELKFRAWSKKYKEWIYIGFSLFGEVTCFSLIERWYYENKGITEGFLDLVLNDTIIEQYTGLKDKNGKEVYEGDILKRVIDFDKSDIKEYIEEVISKGASFCTIDVNNNDDTPSFLANYFCHTIEVIGNIHENPELLNK